MASTLIVDSDKIALKHLATCLRHRGHHVETAGNLLEATTRVAERDYDVIFAGIGAQNLMGFAILREIVDHRPEAIVVLTSDRPNVAEAVQAMRLGAYDYLAKPLTPEQIEVLTRSVGRRKPGCDVAQTPARTGPPPLLKSANAAMALALEAAREAASSDAPIELIGDTGTGKHVLAAAIHQWSARRTMPFITSRCARPSLDLRNREHGHFNVPFDAPFGRCPALRASTAGTIFIEEAPELTTKQTRSQVSSEGQCIDCVTANSPIGVEARFIIAGHPDRSANEGCRLSRLASSCQDAVRIELPSLKERLEDLPGLTENLLARLACRHQRDSVGIGVDARAVLRRHHWPGNIHELLSVLEHAVVLCQGNIIEAEDLPEYLWRAAPPAELSADSLDELERVHIELVMRTASSIREAAERLGIDQATLWRRRKRYGLLGRQRGRPDTRPREN